MYRKVATLTRTATSELLYLCSHCDLQANALVTAKATASTSAGPLQQLQDPGELVAEALREKKRQMIKLAPCPRCKKRDPVAVSVFRNKQILIGVLVGLGAGASALVFGGVNRAGALAGIAVLAAWYAFTQWSLWFRSPARVQFRGIEPMAELPEARVIPSRPPTPVPDLGDRRVEKPDNSAPTPFEDGPSVLK